MNNNLNYSHFAVNKSSNKIVTGWDYSDYESDELRTFANDYFWSDMADWFDADRKTIKARYAIVTERTLRNRGINPDDNANWANE